MNASRIARAQALHRAGNIEGAIEVYREMVVRVPADAKLHSLLGVALLQCGRTAEGVAVLDRSLELNPEQPQALYNCAVGLCSLSRFDAALLRLNDVIAIGSPVPVVHYQMAIALRGLARPGEALPHLDRALELDGQFSPAHTERGKAHLDLGRPEAALLDFARVVEMKPEDADAHYHLGLAAYACQRLEEAIAGYSRALQLNPSFAAAYNNRGRAWRVLNRLDEALLDYGRAIELDPQFAEAYNNRGVALKCLGRFEEGLVNYERAAALKPELADAAWNLALLHLLRGNYPAGWPLYESRWALKPPRTFAQPLWLGDRPLEGLTLLIHAEQGLGDVIQFCRYIPMLAQRRCRIVVEVPSVLKSLLSSLNADIQLVEQGSPLPPFDVQCPIMSLPLAFKTRLETIPSGTPYLYAGSVKAAAIHRSLGAKNRLRVGVVWAGTPDHEDDRNRSIGPALLEAIWDLPIELHSLQKQYRDADTALLRSSPRISDHHRELVDFSDTAALVSAMDLVVSVDTSVAHLCGALAKPVWILLPHSPDFRWLLDRSDSPWYPTATLIRQSAPGDWSGAIHSVRQNLAGLAGVAATSANPPAAEAAGSPGASAAR